MFACAAACHPRDPTADTVKVDVASMEADALAAAMQLEERMRAMEAERAVALAAAEQMARRAAEAELRRRAQLEAEERRQLQEQEDERRRRQEELQARLAEEARMVEEARRQEAARAEAERRAKEQERKTMVAAFLKKHGFSGVSAGKRSLLKTTYPLHLAAEQGNSSMVEMLLQEGANPQQKNSRGKTAAELAKAMDKRGSHAGALRALGGA